MGEAVAWLRRLGVRHLRTGISWADSFRDNALAWFDRQMAALEEFQVTLTFCFTPEHRGLAPHHTSPPQVAEEFAEFCAAMVRRYACPDSADGPRPIASPDAAMQGSPEVGAFGVSMPPSLYSRHTSRWPTPTSF